MTTPQRGRPRKARTSPKSADAQKSPTVNEISAESPKVAGDNPVGDPTDVRGDSDSDAVGGDSAVNLEPASLSDSALAGVADRPEIDVRFREQQWEMLTKADKDRLNMTREEFLTREDVTGFGANSYFTSLEERRGEE